MSVSPFAMEAFFAVEPPTMDKFIGGLRRNIWLSLNISTVCNWAGSLSCLRSGEISAFPQFEQKLLPSGFLLPQLLQNTTEHTLPFLF